MLRNIDTSFCEESSSSDSAFTKKPKKKKSYKKPTWTKPPHNTQNAVIDLAEEANLSEAISFVDHVGVKKSKIAATGNRVAVGAIKDSSSVDSSPVSRSTRMSSPKRKYISDDTIIEKYNKLLRQNHSLGRRLNYKRREVRALKCHLRYIRRCTEPITKEMVKG